MNIEKFVADLERGLEMLRSNREATVNSIRRMMEVGSSDVRSTHLGHNLQGSAQELIDYDAKIYQTVGIINDLKNRIEFSKP